MQNDVLNNYFWTINKDDPISQIKTLVNIIRNHLQDTEIKNIYSKEKSSDYDNKLNSGIIDIKVYLEKRLLEHKEIDEMLVDQVEKIMDNTSTNTILEITNQYYKNLELINVLDKQIKYLDSILHILSLNKTYIKQNIDACEQIYDNYVIKHKKIKEKDTKFNEYKERYQKIQKEIIEL